MAEEYWNPDAAKDYCCRCGLSVGPQEAIDGQCAACQANETTRPPWQRIIRLGEYESPLNRWICEVKFTRWRKLGWDLGRVLGRSIQAHMQDALAAGLIPPGPPIIVPVPMSWPRRWHRGIDHTMAIARGVAAETGGNCEATKPGETIERNGVTIAGPLNLASMGAVHASEMYSRNVFNFVSLFVKEGAMNFDWSDELLVKTRWPEVIAETAPAAAP
jgi:hypothetical protein